MFERFFWFMAVLSLAMFVRILVRRREHGHDDVTLEWLTAGNAPAALGLAFMNAAIALRARGPWAMAAPALSMMSFALEVMVVLRARHRVRSE